MRQTIDLRSDTVTKPTPEMFHAMMHAEVGDDVFGEDPSVNELQEKAAAIFGHEAGLFCPSGTMTNQIAIQVHTRPGDEVICHESSHVYNYEGGGISRNALASVKLVRNESATMSAVEVDNLVNADHDWLARTSLVVAEDTSNRGGGKCYSLNQLSELSTYCQNKQLKLHLDGSRVFNAVVRQNHNPLQYGRLFDSISICLSKGLGTPVGSVLIGPKTFIREARRVRKVMGGGMRQAGFLAAAGIYALDNNIKRINDDHQRALILAKTLQELKGVKYVIPPETNIVIFDVKNSTQTLAALEEKGLKAIAFGKNRIRMVTHLNIQDIDIDRAVEILKNVLA